VATKLKNRGKGRIGDTITATNGQTMTIIGYRGSADIDVQFSDGTIVEHRTISAFNKGTIRNPNSKVNSLKFVTNKIGETSKTTNGQLMTIVGYRNSQDIDIQFSDGTVVYNKIYHNFVKGKVINPNDTYSAKRIGETSKATNGQLMTIIEYNNAENITIQFDDGTIVKHRSYRRFKDGRIKNPSKSGFDYELATRLGATVTATNGQTMKIIGYRNWGDIDVQFEDGTIVKHKPYTRFKQGRIGNPNKPAPKSIIQDKPGEKAVSNKGDEMEIIGYRGCHDIDVQFSDGTVVYNKRYHDFINGTLRNPNKHYTSKRALTNRIGETNKARNGEEMKIIAYRNNQSIDIQFSDGTIIHNRTYSAFKQGSIKKKETTGRNLKEFKEQLEK
jgi:hypothetical protein